MLIRLLGQRAQLKVQTAQDEGESLIQLMHSEYAWRKARKKHLETEGCCQMCGILKKLEVHHIEPWHLAPDLRYEPSNLITLCREDHFRFGHYLNWKSFNPEIRNLSRIATQIKEQANENSSLNVDWESVARYAESGNPGDLNIQLIKLS